MEVTGATNNFHRLENKYNIRYLQYLGYGDTMAYREECARKPKGRMKLQKLSVLDTYKTRIGMCLKTFKKNQNKNSLIVKVLIEDVSKLKNEAIQKHQAYYKPAIVRNRESVKEIKTALWT